MKKSDSHDQNMADLDQLIEEITVDAYGVDEQLWAFLQIIADEVSVPCDGFVIGEPMSSITGRSSAACMGSASACGGSADSRRRAASSTGCSGSTLGTTRAHAS